MPPRDVTPDGTGCPQRGEAQGRSLARALGTASRAEQLWGQGDSCRAGGATQASTIPRRGRAGTGRGQGQQGGVKTCRALKVRDLGVLWGKVLVCSGQGRSLLHCPALAGVGAEGLMGQQVHPWKSSVSGTQLSPAPQQLRVPRWRWLRCLC